MRADVNEIANLIVEGIATKIRALEDLDRSYVSRGGVTVYDKMLIALGTFDSIDVEEPTREDVEIAKRIVEKYGIEPDPELVVTLASVRRFVVEKLRSVGLDTFIREHLGSEKTRVSGSRIRSS